MIMCIFLISPHGTWNVYAAENSGNSISVAKCIQSPKQCEKSDAIKSKEKTDVSSAGNANPFSVFTFFKMILALAFVLLLIYLLLKLVNKKGNLFNQYRYLQNVGGTSLGQNRSIQLVKLGNRIFVIGVADSIQLLKEIDDEEEIKEILADHNHRLDQLTGSKDNLFRWIQNKTKQIPATKNNNTQFGALLKAQLIELRKGRKKVYEQLDKKGNEHNE
jgi:flagellar protein FliO/FliZ